MGLNTFASGEGSLAAGRSAFAGGTRDNSFTNAGTVALGDNARAGSTAAGQTNATALGAGALANVAGGTALGQGASVTAAGSVALGQGSVATDENTVSFGTTADGGQRRLVNVAAGTAATDAVNFSQLNAVSGNANAIGTGAAAAFGGGASFVAGVFTGPTYDFGGGRTFTDVGGALGNLNTRTDSNTTAIASLQSGGSGIVQQDPATTGPITVGGGSGGTSVSFANSGGAARTLTGVAAGDVSAASTQAVNGAQLFATNSQVASNTAAIGVLQGQTTANTDAISALQGGTGGAFQADNAAGRPAPQASGANSTAGGFGAVASGADTVAIGSDAQATFAGAVAIGSGARAVADPTTAVGFQAAATADEASAFGGFATASGVNSTAIGRSAVASGAGSASLGVSANAGGANAVALGTNASAAQAGSSAIGAGAVTTRANQMALGTGATTYTAAGLSTAASRAAQSGPVSLVTTDAAGNLATSSLDVGALAGMGANFARVDAAINDLSNFAVDARKEARQGVAAAMAMAHAPMPSAPGITSWAVNTATFQDEWAGSAAISHRLDFDKPFAVNAAYTYGGGDNHGFRVGLAGEF